MAGSNVENAPNATLHPVFSPLTRDNPRMKTTMVTLAHSNTAAVVRRRGGAACPASPTATNSSPPSSSSIHSAVRPLTGDSVSREIEQPRVLNDKPKAHIVQPVRFLRTN